MVYAKSKFLWFFITIVFCIPVILDAIPEKGEASTKDLKMDEIARIPNNLLARNYKNYIIYQYNF